MKKNLFAAAGAMLLLAAWSLTACGGDTGAAGTETGTSADTSADTAVITETEPVTTEAVTEAPKRDKILYISAYENGTTQSPISLLGKDTSVAIHIASEGILESVSAECPSWNDAIGSLTMKFYAWDTDYATTIAGECLVAETFVDYEDNATLQMDLTDDYAEGGLPAGEYLWVLCDGVDESNSGVGIWAKVLPEEPDPAIFGKYTNGKETEAAIAAEFVVRVPAE